MFKKIIIILTIFALLIAGLQLFGGRDFKQVNLAWNKYSHGGTIGSLSSDVIAIFLGERIKRGDLDVKLMANRLVYRWTDEYGVVHNSDRMPKVEDYEVIRIGDMTMETQEAMSREDIDKLLNIRQIEFTDGMSDQQKTNIARKEIENMTPKQRKALKKRL